MKGKMVLLGVLVLIAVMGVALTAYGATTDSKNVVVNGRPTPKLVLTVDTALVDFGDIDPETPEAIEPAFNANVRSNKDYNYYLTAPASFDGTGTPSLTHLEWSRLAAYAQFPGVAGNVDPDSGSRTGDAGDDYTYDLRLTFGYDVEAGDHAATLVPTALQ